MSRRIKLGQKVRDKITGLEGIATSRTEYLNGCVRYGIQAKLNKDGEVPEVEFTDEEQLEVVKATETAKPEKSGGYHPAPKGLSTPS